MQETALILGFATLLFALVMLVLVPALLRPSAEEQRLRAVVTNLRPENRAIPAREQVEERLLGLATALRSRLGLQVSPKSQLRLEHAGYRSTAAAEIFFAASWLTPLLGAFLGSFLEDNTLFWIFVLVVVGYMVPDVVLSAKITRRRNRIRKALPDAVDLLVICVDAGLGLDQALMRVSDELALSYPDIHQEFSRLHAEQRAGRPRLEAWQSLTERVQLEELNTFLYMLAQADRFGTPLTKSLSRFADDVRTRRRQRAEEAAAKTKVKIIFPLAFFIFPSLFIVLLAPALLSMIHELKGLAR